MDDVNPDIFELPVSAAVGGEGAPVELTELKPMDGVAFGGASQDMAMAHGADGHSEHESVADTAKEGAAFVVLRGISNFIWVGGTVASVGLQRRYGVEPLVACTTIAALGTVTEFTGSTIANKNLFTQTTSGEPMRRPEDRRQVASRAVRELTALGYATWNGAMSTVKVNDTLGLPSTRSRRMVQSVVYGVAVSLWGSQLPLFKQGQDVLIRTGEAMVHNPIESAAVGAPGAVATFGVLKVIDFVKKRRQQKVESANESTSSS